MNIPDKPEDRIIASPKPLELSIEDRIDLIAGLLIEIICEEL